MPCCTIHPTVQRMAMFWRSSVCVSSGLLAKNVEERQSWHIRGQISDNNRRTQETVSSQFRWLVLAICRLHRFSLGPVISHPLWLSALGISFSGGRADTSQVLPSGYVGLVCLEPDPIVRRFRQMSFRTLKCRPDKWGEFGSFGLQTGRPSISWRLQERYRGRTAYGCTRTDHLYQLGMPSSPRLLQQPGSGWSHERGLGWRRT